MTFRIFTIEISIGAIGLCPLPGRFSPLVEDCRRIADWQASIVVSLAEKREMETAGGGDLPALLENQNIGWAHFPIRDFRVPDAENANAWAALSRRLHGVLDGGGRVLLHCFGGQGRSGMIALRLMVERGFDPEPALRRIREVRPGAVETDEQYRWATADRLT